jgi:replication factor A3
MDHPQTPRILAPHLQSFQHKLVRMLGKVVQLRGEKAVIDAGGNVEVILNRVRQSQYFFYFLPLQLQVFGG